ncbi:MAG: dihydrolipoyl dehydrogenase [Actinomycetota bacterium]
MAERFDVVVLGGGPGWYAATLYGAAAGLRVAVVEEQRVGGTCLHQGCVPAKELLQTAEVLRTIRRAGDFGVSLGGSEPTLDVPAAQARKQIVVDKLSKGVEGLLKQRGVVTVPARGALVDGPGRVVRAGDTDLTCDAVILATGSSPRALPGHPFDGVRVLSSDHVLGLAHVPYRVLVVGGGAIGCEFASMLTDFGAVVTIVEAAPRLLPGADEQVAQFVGRRFTRRGIVVHTDSRVTGIDDAAAPTVGIDGPGGAVDAEVDAVVVSIGRAPRTADIGCEDAGIERTASGHVRVDGAMRTNVTGIYAVGDIVDSPQLAHVGFAEAIVAVQAILGEDPRPVEYDKVPWGIYCHPEVAWAGLTEEQAVARGLEVVTSIHRFGGNSRALILGEPEGFVKIVAAASDRTILGVHVVGPWATELVGEGYLAVNWEATADDVGRLVHAHPTLSELFGEAALALGGRGLHG